MITEIVSVVIVLAGSTEVGSADEGRINVLREVVILSMEVVFEYLG